MEMKSDRSGEDFERQVIEFEKKLEELKKDPLANEGDTPDEIKLLEKQIYKLKEQVYSNLTAWQRVQLARNSKRPCFSNYLDLIFEDFIEIHGDRSYGDDPAIVGGFAKINNFKIVILGQEKGKNANERWARNFGMLHPEGYRKAMRLFRLAERFGLPLVNFIDASGAYPGVGAEERGQALAIAENLEALSKLRIPTIAINIAEGGSGGALALGLCDRVYMLENAYYSVITPEGCASILWKDANKAPEAAAALKLTAGDLLPLNIIDAIVKEPLGGANRDSEIAAQNIKTQLLTGLKELNRIPIGKLIAERHNRYRQIGQFFEPKQ